MSKKKDEIKEEIIIEEKKEEVKTEPEIEVISMDNKPISNEVKEEEIVVDKRFTGAKTIKPENKAKEIKINNERVYKEVANGYGMYADNGQVFKIK